MNLMGKTIRIYARSESSGVKIMQVKTNKRM